VSLFLKRFIFHAIFFLVTLIFFGCFSGNLSQVISKRILSELSLEESKLKYLGGNYARSSESIAIYYLYKNDSTVLKKFAEISSLQKHDEYMKLINDALRSSSVDLSISPQSNISELRGNYYLLLLVSDPTKENILFYFSGMQ
jgi:Na+/phosphate symporter